MSHRQETPSGFNFSRGARHRSTSLHTADNDSETITGKSGNRLGVWWKASWGLGFLKVKRRRGYGIPEEGNKIGKFGK